MKREIKTTADGTKTLYINDLEETYHSSHGALQEAQHVFINNGLKLLNNCEINILELGFGTGLNVLVTFDEFLKTDQNHIINYYTIEKYPISQTEIKELAYDNLFSDQLVKDAFSSLHHQNWEEKSYLHPRFSVTKIKGDFHDLINIALPPINLVYYDCFGARVQPDLWEKPILEMVRSKMKFGALLTTYSSKGSFRRNLLDLGFRVEKKAGPIGKREMINAYLENIG